ncbi:hypothetical protein [Amycolatopsis sp. H20-H5]|uniref:hypothetical protein n=1 Tax=Amycolatopsis sp. H20-H5 TaxID=3046309 RepID=UPI002DB59C53|nr:hypothetical protein [Amycolatopsis sp. H20-H5]MEC3975824.1 hypothetical protein [Amycolatopsis sp. H20-H5]
MSDQLSVEFAGRVPRSVVDRTVEAARHDLDGQTPPGALEELLHRLAHYRLDLYRDTQGETG